MSARSTRWARRRAATRPSTRTSAPWRISSGWWRRATPTAWRSPSTSRSSARRTIPGSRTIPNGSSGAPTARSNSPRIPPKKYEDISNVHFYGGALPVALDRAARHPARLVRPGRAHLPGRQPAHQADPVLGMGDRRGQRPVSGRDLPGRGLHPAEDDEEARQGRLPAELHLLHLAQHQAGAHRLRPGARRRDGRVLPPELLRQHARHQPVFPADQRPRRLRDPRHARRDPVVGLRHLQRLRAVRGGALSRQGGIPRTPRNTRSRPGTTTGPATSASTSSG